MKNYTNDELKNIIKELKNGVVYTAIKNNTSFHHTLEYFNGFIHFNYYGSSAIKPTIKDLKWLLNTIYNDCELITPSVYSDEHLNYKPIDEQYYTFNYTTH